jgi:HupE / UreJ protein
MRVWFSFFRSRPDKSVVSLLVALAIGVCFFSLPFDAIAHGISEDDKAHMASGGIMRYIWLGARHMITGYDHLLFLLAVVFFLTTFKDIAKFVTVFTIGHCITLIFATFFRIQFNHYAVDAIIALSVIYKGFDNNGGFQKFFNVNSPNLLGAVFFFGLLHGFGLSTRLQEMWLGDRGIEMLGQILNFNVGVEIGQIAALVVMVGALSLWRASPSFNRFSRVTNMAIIFLGFILFLMQLHGLDHHVSANEFRFPAAEHQHIHQDMETAKSLDDLRNTIK